MSFTENDPHAYASTGGCPPTARRWSRRGSRKTRERREAESAYRLQRDLLRARFDPLLNEAVPPRLLATVRMPAAANDRRFLTRIAMRAAVIAIGVGIGWFGHAWTTRAPSRRRRWPRRPAAKAAVALPGLCPEVTSRSRSAPTRRRIWCSGCPSGCQCRWCAPQDWRHGFSLVGGRPSAGDDRPGRRDSAAQERWRQSAAPCTSSPPRRRAGVRHGCR